MPPLVGVAVKVTLVPEQIVLPGFAAMLTLAGNSGFTVIVMELEVAGEPVAQVALEVITTDTTSPWFRPLFVYVALFVPTLPPFNNHWYDGVPPLVGVAVKVTRVPAHIVFSGASEAMLTLAANAEFTVIVIAFDVAGDPVAQVAFEVITTDTTSP